MAQGRKKSALLLLMDSTVKEPDTYPVLGDLLEPPMASLVLSFSFGLHTVF
jgi:hypothetical protein